MELPLTPLDFLARARRLFPDREAVIDGDERWTYGELRRHGATDWPTPCSGELGVRPGDVVAWLCGNTHELLEAYYGVLLAGGVLLPLNIRLAPAELRSHPRRQPGGGALPPPRPGRSRATRSPPSCSATSYEALLARAAG